MTLPFTLSTRLGLILAAMLYITGHAGAQPYDCENNYSNWTSPVASQFSIDISGCGTVFPPCVTSISGQSNIANGPLNNYATATYTGGTAGTTITARAKLTSGNAGAASTTQASKAGDFAGMVVEKVGISAGILNGITIRTFLNGVQKESKSGSNLQEFASGSGGNLKKIGFTTTQDFDEVALIFNEGTASVGVAKGFRFYYAFGGTTINPPTLVADNFTQTNCNAVSYNILSNDVAGNSTVLDFSSLQIVNQPPLGTANANTSNGTVSFLPNPGATGTATFTYKICVKGLGGNCGTISKCPTVNGTVTINLNMLQATASNTSIACNGGSSTVTLTATGGNSPYQYSKDGTVFQGSNIFTALTAGSYTFVIKDANNCTRSIPRTISEPAVLAATATAVAVSCNGGNNGSFTITGTGALLLININWAAAVFKAATAFPGSVPEPTTIPSKMPTTVREPIR